MVQTAGGHPLTLWNRARRGRYRGDGTELYDEPAERVDRAATLDWHVDDGGVLVGPRVRVALRSVAGPLLRRSHGGARVSGGWAPVRRGRRRRAQIAWSRESRRVWRSSAAADKYPRAVLPFLGLFSGPTHPCLRCPMRVSAAHTARTLRDSAVELSVGVAVHSAALGMPYAAALLKVLGNIALLKWS